MCEEWLYFPNFRDWMGQQEWQDKALDKDLLPEESRVYSPSTCAFISRQLNSFLTNYSSIVGEHPPGVYYNKRLGKYVARCFMRDKQRFFIAYFDDPQLAAEAVVREKAKRALEFVDSEADPRVKQILIKKFKGDTFND